MNPTPEFRLIDLFAGAGGMTAGFVGTGGFVPVWANDFNADACRTYRANFGPHCVDGDLVALLESSPEVIPQATVVIGGPPCQGFSLLNKNKALDPRKQLWRPYMQVVALSRAEVFVMENVPQILGSSEAVEINQEAEKMGFKIWKGVLLAADYGVPQLRKRAFIIGARHFDPNLFFPPAKRTDANRRTVRDAIADLQPPVGVELRDEAPPYNLHFGRTPTPMSQERYRAIPDEGMNRFDLLARAPHLTPECWIKKTKGGTDLFGRLWWDRPAFTIRTEFYKPEKGRTLHPEQHRPITHREAARLQSFPDDFVFTGSKVEIARQIGNAVPPGLAAAVAGSLYAAMVQAGVQARCAPAATV